MITKISIIIPVYNSSKYIRECLNSIKKQTFHDFEVICIDDKSTDNSLDILKKYASNDKRFKIIQQEHKGPGAARNKGLLEAKGEYILFIDSDDWIDKNTLNILYNQATQTKSDLVLFNSIEHYNNNKTRTRIYPIKNYISDENKVFNYMDAKKLVMNSYLIVCTKLHKLEFLRKNNIQFVENTLFEDVLFHIKTMIKAEKIAYTPQILYNYRKEDLTRQSSSLLSRDSFIIFSIFDEVKILLFKNNIYESFKLNFIRFVLTELENIYYNIDSKYKEELFNKIKEYTSDFKLNESQKMQLPKNNRQFYENIQDSETLFDFNLLNTLRIINNTPELIDENELNTILSLIKQSNSKNKNTLYLIENLVTNTTKAYEQINYLTRINQQIISSKSWKITRPLRWITYKLKKILKTNTPPLTNNNHIIQSENKIFKEILTINNDYIDYTTLINQIREKCANINLNSNIQKLLTDKTYNLTIKNNKICQEYENTLYKYIINDILTGNTTIISFNKIRELNLFDDEYYINQYNYKLEINPLLHYIYI
ncbi:glycosyltransferase family 2 protein [Methanosphaera sp. WGK6]|uniref:glycosyltransferase family 2 protein n=1 Tax=Methanosphaera sp. WGK6 TaxID=1561964 RepID=UPI00084CD6AF|nr:glycosyltransferase family 2 protein [Methanosphaera sp. WGK6]OED30385.1 hypothetical protein NL43_03155 [Methanosphaera sp. WGK6]